MPSCALADDNSHPNELQADDSLIAGEKKIKSELIEMLNKVILWGEAGLAGGRTEALSGI